MKKIIIGARGSKLSLAYANRVKKLILKKNSYLSDAMIEIRPITTSGDIFHDKKLSEIGGKNLFCKEIEEALLQNKIDIAIHSLKDMASEEIESLHIGAYIERNDPREALVSLKFNNIKQLDTAIIGSSSRRRNLQLQLINKNILVKNIRGNIDTRIQKLKEGGFDAIILALAGLKSLELEQHAKQIFSTSEMLPAVGQGIIAAQCKKENKEITEILKAVDHHETRVCAIAERNLLKVLGGDCDTAVGGFARLEGQYIILSSQLFSDSGSEAFYHEVKGKIEDAESIGYTVATELLKKAGNHFKKN